MLRGRYVLALCRSHADLSLQKALLRSVAGKIDSEGGEKMGEADIGRPWGEHFRRCDTYLKGQAHSP